MRDTSGGVTRWRRSVVLAAPAGLAVAGMAAAMLQGALAAN
ncbi:cholesterol esterase, partial [Streptomyces sp. NRRL F-6602]